MIHSLTPIRLAAWRFRNKRADYYEHLADIIVATEGHKSLRDIFADDADRYQGLPRGTLSRHWAQRIEDSGGSLAATFADTLPATDVAILAAVQETGGGNLEGALRGLARQERLQIAIQKVTRPDRIVQWMSLALLIGTLWLIPAFLVPNMVDALPVPEQYLMGPAKSLKATAAWLETAGPPILIVLLTVVAMRSWFLDHAIGDWRKSVDGWGSFRQYRDIQAIQFLSTLATIMLSRGNDQTGLKNALMLMRPGASPWLHRHLDTMLHSLDDAVTGPQTFNTGLLDRETYYYLSDVHDALGMDLALAKTRDRVETALLASVERRSKVMRWVSMLLALLVTIVVFLWARSAFDEVTSLLKTGLF